jgi:hypothetical protein
VLRHGGTIDDNDESDDEGAHLHDLVIGLCCVTFCFISYNVSFV